jgi:hypothetical protein
MGIPRLEVMGFYNSRGAPVAVGIAATGELRGRVYRHSKGDAKASRNGRDPTVHGLVYITLTRELHARARSRHE